MSHYQTVGTTTGLVADIGRDGFQGKDLLHAGLNLGGDVMGMIPGLGVAAKSSKVVKNLPKIITMLAAANVSNEVLQSLKKV
mgnify:CR=1 FL=1